MIDQFGALLCVGPTHFFRQVVDHASIPRKRTQAQATLQCMTIGIAIASWRTAERARLHVIADTRVSRGKSFRNDASVKTLEIDNGVAAVFSGDATPVFVGAEMTRTLLRSQASSDPAERFGLYDTARLLCHFTRLVFPNIGERSETVLAGYLRSGAPALARILVTEDSATIAWIRCPQGGTVAIPVGPPGACDVLLQSMAHARRGGTSVVHAAIGAIEYMMRHPGEPFAGIGGQVSLGICEALNEPFGWPAIVIGERTYWRGMDVTGIWSPQMSEPFPINYDETWFARVDEQTPAANDRQHDSGPDRVSYYLDVETGGLQAFPAEDMMQASRDVLFQVHQDPPELRDP